MDWLLDGQNWNGGIKMVEWRRGSEGAEQHVGSFHKHSKPKTEGQNVSSSQEPKGIAKWQVPASVAAKVPKEQETTAQTNAGPHVSGRCRRQLPAVCTAARCQP